MSVQEISGSMIAPLLTAWSDSRRPHNRRRRSQQASFGAAAIESLETRLMLAASPVAGAWVGGVFDSIGVFEDGVWQLDLDGDGFVGDDSPAFTYGLAGDTPIAGDWDGDGVHSVGVHRGHTFYLDLDDDRQFTVAGDAILNYGLIGDVPIAGNWDGIGGDEIGIFRRGRWSLDFSANGVFGPGDVVFNFGLANDVPVTGNWTPATLRDSVAVYRGGTWSIDRNENYAWNGTGSGFDQAFDFGTAADEAFAGDFVGDNTDEVAILQDPPVGDPTFFVRELSSFPGFTATAALTASNAAEERSLVASSTADDDRRDELFAGEEMLL
ncbi:MAG: hypothetical protein WBC44_01000 [Planctomycetaceae bacterium]